MNWSAILYANLVILEYDFESNGVKSFHKLSQFKLENIKSMQNIILFLISKYDRKRYEELSKLSLLMHDKKIERDYRRMLQSWSIEMISRIFENFHFNEQLLISPVEIKSYEILAKLTTTFVQMKIKEENKDGDSVFIRKPVNFTELQRLKVPLPIVVGSMEEDFKRVIRAYIDYLNILLKRREKMTESIKVMTKKINDKMSAINNLKTDINLKISSDFIDQQLIDTLKGRLDKSDVRRLQLLEAMRNRTSLSNQIIHLSSRKPELVRLCLGELKNIDLNQTGPCVSNGQLNLARTIGKIRTELSLSNEQPSLCREIERIISGINLVTSILKRNLKRCSSTREDLVKLRSEMNENVSDGEVFNFIDYGSIPTIDAALKLSNLDTFAMKLQETNLEVFNEGDAKNDGKLEKNSVIETNGTSGAQIDNVDRLIDVSGVGIPVKTKSGVLSSISGWTLGATGQLFDIDNQFDDHANFFDRSNDSFYKELEENQ